MKKGFSAWMILVLLALGVSACSAAGTPTPATEATALPAVQDDFAVSAEGNIVPKQFVSLGFAVGGQVEEIFVAEGDTVKAGDILAIIGDRAPLEASIAQAEAEVLAAEQALQALSDNLPQTQTQALQNLTAARQALRDAERKLSAIQSPGSQTDIDSARATVVLTKDLLDKARKDFAPYENKSQDNVIRAALQSKLAQAQANYDAAVRRLNNLTGTYTNEFDQQQAEAELRIAQQRLELAEKDYNDVQAGPDPDAVAAANARIKAAKATLAAAKSNLSNLELVATIDGTIVNLDLIVGQQVSPGEPVIQIADFSEWYVETTNLTEIEVVRVREGQQATVIPDALLEANLSAQVTEISQVFTENRGDVTYTVRLRLKDVDPLLRWGMTVVITFEK
ncbi:MAG: hypothetical protein OHK0052_18980 [Anaerolineales bacterium]